MRWLGGAYRAFRGRGSELAPTHGGPDDQRGADEHEVLDDVLPFECGSVGERAEGLLGKEHERRQRARHLGKEQEKGCPEIPSRQQAQPDEGFPRGEQRQADLGADQTE